MSIRAKLLQALGDTDIHHIGEEALVDILVDKIKGIMGRKGLHHEK